MRAGTVQQRFPAVTFGGNTSTVHITGARWVVLSKDSLCASEREGRSGVIWKRYRSGYCINSSLVSLFLISSQLRKISLHFREKKLVITRCWESHINLSTTEIWVYQEKFSGGKEKCGWVIKKRTVSESDLAFWLLRSDSEPAMRGFIASFWTGKQICLILVPWLV